MSAHVWRVSLLIWSVMMLSSAGSIIDNERVQSLLDKHSLKSGDIDLSKPGTCPAKPSVSRDSPSVCTFVCLFDLECPGTQRCCQDDCGGTACVETTENVITSTEETTSAFETSKTTPMPSTTVQPASDQPTEDRTASTDVTTRSTTASITTTSDTENTTQKSTTQTTSPQDDGGHFGQNSSLATNPCDEKPRLCQNGGTCIQTTNETFECKCAAGWDGNHCENMTSLCSSRPCLNGGECIEDGMNEFECRCPPKYTGPSCGEELVPEEPTGGETTSSPTTAPMFDVCYLPLNTGNCSRKETKWYYDTETKQCRPFIYNGCGGNANRFRNYDECQWECPRLPRDPCSHPIVTGRCKAKIPRWAYSAERKTCVEFVYGGCAPTGNNFLTRDECVRTCVLDHQEPCSCLDPSLPTAICNSDFVITGIVRRQIFSRGQLGSVVVEVTRKYKGSRDLNLRRSRFVNEPVLVTKRQSTRGCVNQCFDDLQDGREYILTGTISREGGRKVVAFLTSRSYVKRAVGHRVEKLERIASDRSFRKRCSVRLTNPL